MHLTTEPSLQPSIVLFEMQLLQVCERPFDGHYKELLYSLMYLGCLNVSVSSKILFSMEETFNIYSHAFLLQYDHLSYNNIT